MSFLRKISNPYRLCLAVLSRFYNLKFLSEETFRELDFGGYIKKESLFDGSQKNGNHATAYSGFNTFYSRILVNEALKGLTPEDFDFIDIGSGKGKLVYYARKFFKFSMVRGVEFSGQLDLIAKKNLIKNECDSKRYTLVNCDASNYLLPDHKQLIFLFNPFGEKILKSFLLSNQDHFKKHKSIVIYANAMHGHVFEKQNFKSFKSKFIPNCFFYSI